MDGGEKKGGFGFDWCEEVLKRGAEWGEGSRDT